jgi:hypothetical protein
MERSDIIVAKLMFLCTVCQIRVSGNKCPVFYVDESWINQKCTLKYIWKDSTSNDRLKVSAKKGG